MTIEEAKDNGAKAAEAMHNRDISLYNFRRDWFRKAIAVTGDNKDGARGQLEAAWRDGYSTYMREARF